MKSEVSKNIIAAPLVVAGSAKVSLVINNDRREVMILVGSYHLSGYVSHPAINSLEKVVVDFPADLDPVTRTEKKTDLLALFKDPLFHRAALGKPEGSEALSEMLYNAAPDHVYSIFQRYLVLRREGPPTKPLEFRRGTREELDALCYAIVYRYADNAGVLRVTGQVENESKVVTMEYKETTHNESLVTELCNVAKTDFVYVGYDQRPTNTNSKERPNYRHLPSDWERFTPPIAYHRKDAPYHDQQAADEVLQAWCGNHGIVQPSTPMSPTRK